MRLHYALIVLLLSPVLAQWREKPMTGSQPEMLPDRTDIAGQSGLGALITAQLVDEHANARQHRAVVQVQTDGLQIIDGASANYAPRLNQAHIQYQLDAGAPADTTSRRIELAGLSPGEHQIRIALVGNDNKPIGHQSTLKVHIPQ